MNILFLIAFVSQPLFGLSIRQFARRSRSQNDQRKFFNNTNKTQQMKRKNSKGKQILSDFQLNHQNCYIISQQDHRRQVHCFDVLPHHGEATSLFQPFETAAKWLSTKTSKNLDLNSFHG